MEIKTKFGYGDSIVTINYDEIVSLQIIKVQITVTKSYTRVNYILLISKAIDSGMNDLTVEKGENECFKNIDELIQFYRSKL